MTLQDLFFLFKRNWIIVLVFPLVTILITLLIVEHTAPVYEASCKLLIVDINKSGTLSDQSNMVLGTLGKADPITTQVEVMKTRPVYEEVIRECNLMDNTGLFLNPADFAARLSVEAVRLSNIIKVTYKCDNPDSAAKILNTYARITEELNQKLNREEVSNMRLFIEKQLALQKVRLEEIEQASVNFKTKEKTVDIDLQTKSQIDAASNTESAIMKLEGEREGVLAQQSQLESYINEPKAHADPFYLSRLNMLEQIKTRLSSIDAQNASLKRQLSLINSQLAGRPQEEVNLSRYLRDGKIAERTYTDLLSKLQELEIKEAARPSSIKVVESAIPPEQPVTPKKKKSIVIALLAGIFLGCGTAYAIAYIKGYPQSIATIKSALPYDILGTIPDVKNPESIQFRNSTVSLYTESIRHIHTSLNFKNVCTQHSNLMVTSATTGEGKRLFCVNLAYSLAEAGRKVVLINLDLRRKVFSSFFTPKTGKGITDYLSGNAELQEILSRQPEDGFDIIDAGTIAAVPSRLFQRGSTEVFLKKLESEYDICLFYGAPILTASETLDVGRFMSGIILLADMKHSNVKSLLTMQELLEHKNLPVLGTVVNRV